jgi:hypothetical protein
VSSKRYCLFNYDEQNRPIIRKASAHGLGDVMLPTGYVARFEHLAAPVKTEKEIQEELDKGTRRENLDTRKHGRLVAGSAAPLFLDMWYAAIGELREKETLKGVDKVICAWPELKTPQHHQASLSTRDAWLHFQNLPNRRAFQFFETLPPPMMTYDDPGEEIVPEGQEPTEPELMFIDIKEAEGASLYKAFSRGTLYPCMPPQQGNELLSYPR